MAISDTRRNKLARAKSHKNGRVEEAMAMSLQNQTSLLQNQTAFLARIADMDKIIAERFASIESILLDHSRVLAEHGRLLLDHSRTLQALPEAVGEKNGFKAPHQS
jgi:hypothetical protein